MGSVGERTTTFYNAVREVLAEVKVTFKPRHRGGENGTDLWASVAKVNQGGWREQKM